MRLPPTADGVGARRSLTVAPDLRHRTVLGPPRSLDGISGGNYPRQSRDEEPALDGHGNDCQASLRHSGMTGRAKIGRRVRKNTALTALSAISGRRSGVRVWRASAETWPSGPPIGHCDTCGCKRRRFGRRLLVVFRRLPTIERQNKAGDVRKRPAAQAPEKQPLSRPLD